MKALLPLASAPTTKPTNSAKKKGGGGRGAFLQRNTSNKGYALSSRDWTNKDKSWIFIWEACISSQQKHLQGGKAA
jgi:hypothetical protein